MNRSLGQRHFIQRRTGSAHRAALGGSLCLLGIFSGGCQELVQFRSRDAGISNPAFVGTWHGPTPVDLSDTRDPTDYATVTPTSFYGIPAAFNVTATPQSYGTFSLHSAPGFGVLMASFWDGQNYRPFGRVYNPVARQGAGWASYGPQASFLDGWLGTDFFYLAFGISPQGAGLSVFSDGVTAANSSNTLLTGDQTWLGMRSQLGQLVGPAVVTTPGRGYLPPDGNNRVGYAVNGTSTSIAWDQGGHAFYSFVDATSSVAYLQRYTAFTNWDTNPMRLGPYAQQTQLVGDGFGITQFWQGQDLLQANSISLGSEHGCAITPRGLACWGQNDYGQLGYGEGAASEGQYPELIKTVSPVASVSAGSLHTCGVTQNGSLLCWGNNDSGQVGNNNPGSSVYLPTAPTGITGTVAQVATGTSHSCAITDAISGGKLYCWGLNDHGQVSGDGLTTPARRDYPETVSSSRNRRQVAVGGNHTCVYEESPSITTRCFGDNTHGQSGNAPLGATQTEGDVLGIAAGTQMLQIAAGGNTSCALTAAGAILSWGVDALNANQSSAQTIPLPGGAGTPIAIAVGKGATGSQHACFIDDLGNAYCWGRNGSGQLGNGTNVDSATPVRVSLPYGVYAKSISAGDAFSCATTSSSQTSNTRGPTYCWGSNSNFKVNGRIADGSTSLSPIEIAASSNQALHASWSINSSKQYDTLSTGDVKSMSAAASPYGDVVAVYLQTNPAFVPAPTGTISSSFPIRNNNVRVYASSRGASGEWSGPTRIDDAAQIGEQTTTTFQDAWGRTTEEDARITGGIEYFTPAVAYLGNGKFIAAYAMTDLTLGTSSIYARRYLIGSGWEPASETIRLDSITLSSATLEPYRYANELHLSSDGQGNALLVAQVVVPSGDGSDYTLRNYGVKAFTYSEASGGWASTGTLFPASFCPATSAALTIPAAPGSAPLNFCWPLKPQGMVLPGGEGVVVFPASADPFDTDDDHRKNLRLFSTELHL